MVIKTAIEIKQYGDFDLVNTKCIMVSEDKYDFNHLLQEFYKQQGITSNKGLDDNKLNEITEKFIKFLKSKDFYQLKTQSVLFTD